MSRQHRATVGLLAPVALVVASVVAAQGPDFVRVKVETANVRKAPSTGAAALRRAYEDDPLRVIAARGAWLRVRDFEGGEGWIYAPLTDQRPTVIVTASVANIRSSPGTTNPVTYAAERGVAFRVVRARGDWLEVEHAEGARGWVHRALVWGDLPDAGSRH